MKISFRSLTFAVFACAVVLSASTLLAQDGAVAATEEDTFKAVPYGLFILGMILGISNVVRPGKRKGEKKNIM